MEDPNAKPHQTGRFIIEWKDSTRAAVAVEPEEPRGKKRSRDRRPPPPSDHPNGVDMDATGFRPVNTCLARLPYPAKGPGAHILACRMCGQRMVVTAEGKPDDARSVRMACKPLVPRTPAARPAAPGEATTTATVPEAA